MLAKLIQFKTLGMNLDLSESAFNPQFSFENRNIRLSPMDGNTLMSMTNERGTKSIGVEIVGTPIGYSVIDGRIVLFTVHYSGLVSNSNIYLITIDKLDNVKTELMYSGDLNFSTRYPIETLASYENKNAIKVYWTDGLNQPRVINIAEYLANPNAFRQKKTNTLFDFVATLELHENCSVVRADQSSGTFSPGTVQYVCTYYNKYGGESNIFYTSSVHYVSFSSRGASPEERVSNAFNILLDGLDKNFSYVRIYSIHRTSLDAVPTVRRVVDLEITDSEENIEVEHSASSLISFGKVSLNENITTELWQGRPLGWFCTTNGYYEPKEDSNGTYLEIPLYTNEGALSSFVTFMNLTYYCHANKKSRTRWYLKVYYSNSFLLENITNVILVNKDPSYNIYWWTTNTSNVRKVSYTDDGESGDAVDPTILLYIGGKEISAGTMTLKDNTLFLGNIKSKGSLTEDSIKETIKGLSDSFQWKNTKMLQEATPSGVYPYENHLNKSLAEISTFKYGEYYRVGVQLLKPTGEWSEPLFINDFLNNVVPNGTVTSSTTYLTRGELTLSSDIVSTLKEKYSRIRPVIVYPSYTDREVICLGVLNPTVYNVQDRNTNSPYALSSWFFRPNPPINNPYSLSTTGNTSRNYLLLALLGFIPKGDTTITLYKDGVTLRNKYSIRPIGLVYSTTGTPEVYLGLFTVLDSNIILLNSDLDLLKDGLAYGAYIGDHAIDGICIVGYGNAWISGDIRSDNDNILYILDSDTSRIVNISCNNTLLSEGSGIVEPFGGWGATISIKSPSSGEVIDNLGSFVEFRHGYSLKSALSKSAELQCTMHELTSPEIGSMTRAEYSSKYSDLFFVDLSIVTLNSPDLEWDTNLSGLNEEGVQLKIVGYVPITGTASDIDIQTSTPALNYRASEGDKKTVAEGFYKEGVGATNISSIGYKSLVTVNAWLDELFSGKESDANYNSNHLTYGFPIYPWHRNGSLNNQSYNSTSNSKDSTAPDNYRSAKLKKKKMSNLRTSYRSIYLPSSSLKLYLLSGLQVFNSDQLINTRLNSPTGEAINYYGNVDKLVTNLSLWTIEDGENELNIIGYKLAATLGYYSNQQHYIFNDTPSYLAGGDGLGGSDKSIVTLKKLEWKDCFGTDPILMKYKSGIHAILSLQASLEAEPAIKVLPNNGLNSVNSTSKITPFWSSARHTVSLDTISESIPYGYLWLADLVRTNVSNRFGGDTPDAILNNSWIPCGKEVSLDSNEVTVQWDEGDTYYLRYDCLKTYPFTLEDSNSIVDILSFMCETRINIDGRYDKNRGQSSNLIMMPTNFNLLNNVYTLKNNFFNYRVLDDSLFNFESYPNTITWTKTKSDGEKVDTWTNVTLASTMDLDCDRGKVTKLVKFNDNILALQEKGISLILYNEQTQVSTEAGVPIEIANSGKVTGKRYISDRIGCLNKWSVAESPTGIYFIDDYNNSIQLFNGLLVDLSSSKGFHNWIKNNTTLSVWNPKGFSNIVSYYDQKNQEVLFITKNDCLAFSEGLNAFSSFYSYGNSPYFINLDGKGIWIRTSSKTIDMGWNNLELLLKQLSNAASNAAILLTSEEESISPSTNDLITWSTPYCELWSHLEGDYNSFFGKYEPFSTTVIVNPDYLYDKVFSTLDFRSDVWDSNGNYKADTTFDTLETWNEYLHGKITFTNECDRPSPLKKKFRVWRALIPRNNFKSLYDGESISSRVRRVSRDRMRNPWLYLKLSKEDSNTDKTVLHDMIVTYFI